MEHEKWMHMAIAEALKGRGQVEPNPIVGAVLVEGNGQYFADYHKKFGGPHAEINVLKQLDRKPMKGSILYVTLEPCSTQGRTGACTTAIIEAGISTVVLGAIDPNPAHNGRGIQILEEAGIDVQTGILSDQCRDLNIEFNAQMKKQD